MRERVLINKTVVALISLALLVAVTLAGCEGYPDLTSLARSPFKAEVVGTVDGIELCGEIYCDPTPHSSDDVYERLTVSFTSPATLSGMTVSLRSDGKGYVRLGDTVAEDGWFADMAYPFLFVCPSGEPLRIDNDGEEIVAVFDGGEGNLTYTFDQSGNLKRVSGAVGDREIDLKVKIEEQK